jgi:hypothetical protein
VNFPFPASGNNEKKIDSLRRIRLPSKVKTSYSAWPKEWKEKKNQRGICQPGRKDGRTELVYKIEPFRKLASRNYLSESTTSKHTSIIKKPSEFKPLENWVFFIE